MPVFHNDRLFPTEVLRLLASGEEQRALLPMFYSPTYCNHFGFQPAHINNLLGPFQFCTAILALWTSASAHKVCGIDLISAGSPDF